MGMIDSLLHFSDAQALSGAGSVASTNKIDLGSDRNIGPGQQLWLVVLVSSALDDSDADETYSVALQTDDNEGFSSPTDIATLTFARGDAAGTRAIIGLPYANERYLRLNYTLGGTTPSGSFTAYITNQPPYDNTKYPNAI